MLITLRCHYILLSSALFVIVVCLLMKDDSFLLTPPTYTSLETSRSYRIVGDSKDSSDTLSGKFILVVQYGEQFNNAIENLFALVQLARDLNAVVVQPFTSNSRLYGLPYKFETKPVSSSKKRRIPLDNVLDINRLNDILLTRYNFHPMVTFQEYIQTSSRQLVFVHIVDPYAVDNILPETSQMQLLKTLTKKGSVINCNSVSLSKNAADKTLEILTRETVKNGLSNFRISQVVCLYAAYPTTPVKIRNAITRICPTCDTASVIFSYWKGVTSYAKDLTVPVSRPSLCLPNITFPLFILEAYPFSETIKTMANKFVTDTVGKSPFIIVHVRSEKIGYTKKQQGFTFDECLNKTLNLRDKILKKHSGLQVIYVTDYGKYGSHTIHKKECLGKILTQHAFHEMGIKPVHFDPVTYNSLSDSGFVAGVELSAMSQATYVILLGGGNFQVSNCIRIIFHCKN